MGDYEHCARGAFVRGTSVMKKPLHFENIDLEVDWGYPLSYNVSVVFDLHDPSQPKSVINSTCRASSTLGKLFTRRGINAWNPRHNNSYSANPTIADQQRLADPVVTGAGDYGTYTFFLQAMGLPGQAKRTNLHLDPAGPQCIAPGTDVFDPMDCCLTSSFSAWSCYANNVLGSETIPLVARGQVTVLIDTWRVNVTSTHHVDLSYTNDVMHFSTAPNTNKPRVDSLSWGCDTVTFLNPADFPVPPR